MAPDPWWEIVGGTALHGTVRASGAKNAVTKELVATLLTPEPCVLSNVPRIDEIEVTLGMLSDLGSRWDWLDENTVRIETPSIDSSAVSERYSGMNRIPILLIGPLLNRIGHAEVPVVGGCTIGERPLDFHVDGLKAMGATIDYSSDTRSYQARAARLQGCHHRLPFPSVGATENLLLSAVTALGTTVIENAAIEPEIIDLILMLQNMGAVVSVEVDRRIIVEGVRELGGARHRVLDDRIEVASYAAAAVATGGEVEILGARQEHLLTFLNTLRHIGGEFQGIEGGMRFAAPAGKLTARHIETGVHPGFMTDWQQPTVVLLTQVDGPSVIHETVYENRFGYTDTLRTMGANIVLTNQCLGSRRCRFADRNFVHSAVVTGPTPLAATDLAIPDLRAGFAYVMAALLASGTSTIRNVHYLTRGYEDIPGKLRSLGAKVSVHGLDSGADAGSVRADRAERNEPAGA